MQPRFNLTPSAERVTVKGPKAEARATHENNVHDVNGYMAQRQARRAAAARRALTSARFPQAGAR